jgi:hypothetical protein
MVMRRRFPDEVLESVTRSAITANAEPEETFWVIEADDQPRRGI